MFLSLALVCAFVTQSDQHQPRNLEDPTGPNSGERSKDYDKSGAKGPTGETKKPEVKKPD